MSFSSRCRWSLHVNSSVWCDALFLSFSAYKWMHGELKGNVALQYLAWVSYPMILVMFASLFCHLVSPQAIGELSITCQPLLSSPTTCFYLLLFIFLLKENSMSTSCFFPHRPSTLTFFSLNPSAVFSFLFLPLHRFWYPWAKNHPERCRPEGVSHAQSFHSQSHWPDCWPGQRDASGQRGNKQTNPPSLFFIISFFYQHSLIWHHHHCVVCFLSFSPPPSFYLFFLSAGRIINHPLSCFPSLSLLSWDWGKLFKSSAKEYIHFPSFSSRATVTSSVYPMIYLPWYNMSQFRFSVSQTQNVTRASPVSVISSVHLQGPFVHIASICAAVLSRFMSIFSGVYEVSWGPDQKQTTLPISLTHTVHS